MLAATTNDMSAVLRKLLKTRAKLLRLAQGAGHRQHHPADEQAGQSDRRTRDGVRAPLVAIVEEIQHDREQSCDGGQVDGLERAEQLVNAADGREDVPCDADEQRVPSHPIVIDAVTGEHHDARRSSRRAGDRSNTPAPTFSPSSLEATAEATVPAPAGVRWKKS